MAARAASLLVLAGAAAPRAGATGASRPGAAPRALSAAELVAVTRSSRTAAGAADPAFDCAWRAVALDYAPAVNPSLTPAQLAAIADALELVALNCSTPAAVAAVVAAHAPAPLAPLVAARAAAAAASVTVYVDYGAGSDGNPGTLAAPVKTVAAAVALTRAARGGGGGGAAPAAVILRGGAAHVLNATVRLTPADSFLTFTSLPGEAPVVTGARPLPPLAWAPYNVTNGTAPAWLPISNGTNAVFGECTGSNPAVPDKGVMPDAAACEASCHADAACTAWTYHTPACGAACAGWIRHCCWRLDGAFPATPQPGVVSQDKRGAPAKNVWVAAVALPAGVPAAPALRVNGHRATLARFPNADPERDLFPVGYLPAARAWLPPAPGPVANETYTVDLDALGLGDGGRGVYANYTVGIGGNAARYTPPVAFWASADFGPRSPEQPTATMNRWAEMHLRSPSGVDVGDALVNMPPGGYASVDQLVVRTWRVGHWYSWMFGVGSQSGSALTFDGRGGHQGGEGCDAGAEYWVEGALEELDAANEFFYDAAAGRLFFMPNASDANPDGSPRVATAEVPALSTLFSLYGAEDAPVRNVTFAGLAFTGGRPTFFDPHGQPAGGDWAIERDGALLLEGTEDALVGACAFAGLDSNAVFLSGYNRRARVLNNEFASLGNSAVAAWGRADGYDGTGGQQPRHTLVAGNVAHDLGFQQKQSSFYFQSVSAETALAGNVVYNIPRAAVNWEDGFGGANEMTDNLLFNTCRESSDHSSVNSWDRQPFVTLVRDGVTPSAVPAFNVFHHNMLVNNYGADGGCFDTDDGSSWYRFHDNVCVFSGHKSDFDGHSKESFDNLHLYSSVYGDRCFQIGAQILPLPGFPEAYYSNTCVLVPGAQCFDLGQPASNFPAPGADFIARVRFYNNTIYTTAGPECAVGGGPFATVAQFQAGGYEVPGEPATTLVAALPDAATLERWMRDKLAGAPARVAAAAAAA